MICPMCSNLILGDQLQESCKQANSVDLNLTPDISVKDQRFKYSTRAYMGTPEKTHIEFTVKHNVNVNDKGNMMPCVNINCIVIN